MKDKSNWKLYSKIKPKKEGYYYCTLPSNMGIYKGYYCSEKESWLVEEMKLEVEYWHELLKHPLASIKE